MYYIIVKGKKSKEQIYIIENGNLVETLKEEKNIEGNIYFGKVQNILPGMQAAFIDIGEEKNTFIHAKDLLPKTDETKQKPETEINISKIVKPGDKIMVQVKRAESCGKGARVSTHIDIGGKYAVLMPNTSIITISKKIENPKEQERLRKIASEIVPKNMGLIIRTSAIDKSKEEIEKDVEKLYQRWSEILLKSEKIDSFPSIIYESNGNFEKILIDLAGKQVGKIITDEEETYSRIQKVLEKLDMENIQISLEENLMEKYNLSHELSQMENRKIWLNCGGFITIDKTEALVAIDVNSGKFTGSKNLEQTVFTVNKEATIEIAKQLKLRDIGGIIIIDYIDMQKDENKKKIEDMLKEELKKDRTKTQVIGFTKLNLLEMTRKHIS